MNDEDRIRKLNQAASMVAQVAASLDPLNKVCACCQRKTYRRKPHLIAQTMLGSVTKKINDVMTKLVDEPEEFNRIVPMEEALRE